MSATRYSVYITPLATRTTYGTEVDVSDFVLIDGVSVIRRGIDSADYEIGAYAYDDLELRAVNRDGYFNDGEDYRSIFPYSRDLAKVRVVFTNDDDDTIVYRGLINEEATRLNPTQDEITFRVLSLDSVIRKTNVASGVVSDGMSVSSAIQAILADARITAVLTVDDANINPALDFTIDDGSWFDDKPSKQALDKLLLASSSVMLIDSSQNVIVSSRVEDTDTAIHNLYGPYDQHHRQNVIGITAYNTGKHRMFTSVKVNNTVVSDQAMITDYGFRQKELDLDFVTDPDTEEEIATQILDEFKAPKIECHVEVPTYVARDFQVLDRVAIYWPLRTKALPGNFIPVYGQAVYGDSEEPYPETYGSLEIPPTLAFKIIEIAENPAQFETILKLRQLGSGFSGGVFNAPGNNIYGYAIYGDGAYGDGEDEGLYDPSVLGAAVYGETTYAEE